MAMSKAKLREWPHNGQPSPRHVWKEFRTESHTGGGHSARCERCASYFNSRADTRGPVYCYPTAEWMAAHPDDNGWAGAVKTPFG